MKNKFLKLSIKEIKKNIGNPDLNSILRLVTEENGYSLLSKLNNSIIKKYLKIAINSKHIFLYILKERKEIIGYSLFARNAEALLEEFDQLKFDILFDLLIKFKFISILNILLALTKLDLIMINKKELKKKNKILNLNLLAIQHMSQSKGYGNYFLQRTLKEIYREYLKFNYVACEAPTLRAFKFYTKKCKFRYIGKKIRVGKNFFVLKKRYK